MVLRKSRILLLTGAAALMCCGPVSGGSFSWDENTVFLLNAENGSTAKTKREKVSAVAISGKKTAEVRTGSDGAKAWTPDLDSALCFPVPAGFPSRSGTIEMLVRPAEDAAPTADLQHLISIFKHAKARFYFRFGGGPGLHALWQSEGSAPENAYGTLDRVTYRTVPGWTHLAIQWDCMPSGKANVQFWQDGQLVASRQLPSSAFPEFGPGDKIWIGSWAGGSLPLQEAVVRAVRISKGPRFLGRMDLEQDKRRLSSAVDSLKRQVETLSGVEKGELAASVEKLGEQMAAALRTGDSRSLFLTQLSALQQRLKSVGNSENVDDFFGRYPDAVQDGVAVFYGSSLEKMPYGISDYLPGPDDSLVPNIQAAVREGESFQIVMVTDSKRTVQLKPLPAVRVRETDSDPSARIGPENIEIYRVEYIDRYYADPLRPVEAEETLLPGVVNALWVTVYVPENTPPGSYSGAVVGEFEDGTEREFGFRLEVSGFSLPVQSSLKTAFGFSPEFAETMIPELHNDPAMAWRDAYIAYMLKHRTSPKFNPKFSGDEIIPSNRELFNPRLILKADGSIHCDFTEFDRQVEKYLPLGLNAILAGGRYWDRQNSARGVLRRGGDPMKLDHRLWVYDEALQKDRILELTLNSREYKATIQSVFAQWQAHLKERGWLGLAYGYILDEPPPAMYPLVSTLYGFAKEAAPEIPLLITHAYEPAMTSVDIWCPMFHQRPVSYYEQSPLEQTHWYYVCAQPSAPYGNFLLPQSAMDHRIVFWQTWKYNGKGFLYWEVNWWANKPSDLRSFSPHMDGVLMYPGKSGPIGSIRYEIIRDGIEDFDYLALLKHELDSGKVRPSDRTRAAEILGIPSVLTAAPDKYTSDISVLTELRREIAQILERANRPD